MPERVCIPVSRSAAVGRAAGLLLCGALLASPACLVWPSLRLVPSAVSNRIGEYGLLWLTAFGVLAGVVLAWRALRWLALACWPGRLGFFVDDAGIEASLGPFGRWRCDWSRVAVDWPEYLFDLDLDAGDPLPIRECPAIRAPGAPPVDVQIRRFAALDEDAWWAQIEPRVRGRLFADARWRD